MYKIKIIPIGIPPSPSSDLEAKNKAQEIEIERLMKLLQKQCDEMGVLMNLNKQLEGKMNRARGRAKRISDRFTHSIQSALRVAEADERWLNMER